MKKSLGGIAAAIVVSIIGFAGQSLPAAAMPLSTNLVSPGQGIVDVQFRRHRPVCTTQVVRRRTPHGWVVNRVRRCR